MVTKDYSEEENYYSQGFEKDGVVSIWVGQTDNSGDPKDLDVLQDLCGVGYYDLASQEGNCFDFKRVSLTDLLNEMSYSNTFIEQALNRAREKTLLEANWVTLQYDFEYDPQKVNRKISNDPVFLGSFPYKKG